MGYKKNQGIFLGGQNAKNCIFEHFTKKNIRQTFFDPELIHFLFC